MAEPEAPPSRSEAFAEELAEVHRQRRHAHDQAIARAAEVEASTVAATTSWHDSRRRLLQQLISGLWRRWEAGFGVAGSRRQRRKPPARGLAPARREAEMRTVRRQLASTDRQHRRLARLPRWSWPALLVQLHLIRLRLTLAVKRGRLMLLVLALLPVVLALLWVTDVPQLAGIKERIREFIELLRLGYGHGST